MDEIRKNRRPASVGLIILVLAALIAAAVAAQALPLLYEPAAGVTGNPPTLVVTGVRADVGPMGDRVVGVGRNLIPVESAAATPATWWAFGGLAALLGVLTVMTLVADRRLAMARRAEAASRPATLSRLRPERDEEARRKAA